MFNNFIQLILAKEVGGLKLILVDITEHVCDVAQARAEDDPSRTFIVSLMLQF